MSFLKIKTMSGLILKETVTSEFVLAVSSHGSQLQNTPLVWFVKKDVKVKVL